MSQKGGSSHWPLVLVMLLVSMIVIGFIFVAIFVLGGNDDNDVTPTPTPVPIGCSYPTISDFSGTDYYLRNSMYNTAQAGGSGDNRQCTIPDSLTDYDAFEAEFKQSDTNNTDNGMWAWSVTNNTDAIYTMWAQFYDDENYFHTRFVIVGQGNSVTGWSDRPINKEPDEWPVLYDNQSYFFGITMTGEDTPIHISTDNNGKCLIVPSSASDVKLLNIIISIDSDTQLPVITPTVCTTSKTS